MVPIKREPLTAFVSDTEVVPAEAMETAEEGVLVVVIGHQVLYPYQRGDGKTHTCTIHIHIKRERERATRGRSNDTGYRVFHKDSMKIARDFITEEMSVNKNEYADGASERWYGGEKREEPVLLSATRSSSYRSFDIGLFRRQAIRKCDFASGA